MITEFLINIFLAPLSFLLGKLPDVSIPAFASLADTSDAIFSFGDFVRVVCYFFPMGTVLAIVGIIFLLYLFRFIMSCLRILASLIPFY